MLTHTFGEVNQVRSYKEENGIDWFHGGDVCAVLAFKNPTASVQLHTDEDERKKVDVGTLNDAWFISEPGLWGMILASKSPTAKQFKRWLKHEVLPKLRAEGGYILPTATSAQLDKMAAKIEHQQFVISGLERRVEALAGLTGDSVAGFYGKLKLICKSKLKTDKIHYCNHVIDNLSDIGAGSRNWQIELDGCRLSDYQYRLDDLISASRLYIARYSSAALPQFDGTFTEFAA